MEIQLIKNDQDYEKALQRLELVFDSPANTLEGDEAELLSLLI